MSERLYRCLYNRTFFFCLGCLMRSDPRVKAKALEYGFNPDPDEGERIRVHFKSGVIREMDVTGQDVLDVLQSVINIIR